MFKAGGDGVRLQFVNGSIDSVNRFNYDTFVNKWFSYNEEWKPLLFMPKEATRIWLKVTDVRVERLQEMTLKDFKAEGIYDEYKTYSETYTNHLRQMAYPKVFARLWNSTIKKSDIDKYGWDASPWVWVIEFERCEKPEECE